MGRWGDDDRGVLTLPSGRRLRGRELRIDLPIGPPPEFGVYLDAPRQLAGDCPAVRLAWRVSPAPQRALVESALIEAWRRCVDERVEIGCASGRGPVGTALACLAVLDGASPAEAVRLVEDQYEGWTVGLPWNRWFIGRFAKDVAA